MTASIRQVGTNAPNSSSVVTMGASPVDGNLLLAICDHWGNNPAAGTGWTRYSNNDGSTGSGTAVFYRYASADGTSLTPTTAAFTNDLEIVVWELAGMSGTIGTDLLAESHDIDQTALIHGITRNATSYTTTANNVMMLGMYGGNVSTLTTQAAPTVSSDQTTNLHTTAMTVLTPGNATRVGATYYDNLIASSGTGVQANATWSAVDQLHTHHQAVAIQWTAGGGTETSTVIMGFAGIAMSAAAAKSETAAAVMGFAGIGQAVAATVAAVVAAVTMGFSGISQEAVVYKPAAPGTGKRLWWTA